jgi:uncharacterized protein YaaW (UPF0174 family)
MKNPVFDKDLTPLLHTCANDDLEPLVNIITTAPSQTLTIRESYRTHNGDHRAYLDEIVYEITTFGGNSLANLVRGHGVPYAEMVRDVARTLGVKPLVTDTTATLEEKIVLKILEINYRKMDDEDRTALAELIDIDGIADGADGEFPAEEMGKRLGDAATSLVGDRIQNAIDLAARSATIRRTLLSTAKATLTKIGTLSFGGPVSWAAGIGQAVYDLFGPNYTIAIGLIAQIALLRQKYAQIERDILPIQGAATEEV